MAHVPCMCMHFDSLCLVVQGVDLQHDLLVFQCSVLAKKAPPSELLPMELDSGLSPTDADPLAQQAFALSSRPAAQKKIWIDFQV